MDLARGRDCDGGGVWGIRAKWMGAVESLRDSLADHMHERIKCRLNSCRERAGRPLVSPVVGRKFEIQFSPEGDLVYGNYPERAVYRGSRALRIFSKLKHSPKAHDERDFVAKITTISVTRSRVHRLAYSGEIITAPVRIYKRPTVGERGLCRRADICF